MKQKTISLTWTFALEEGQQIKAAYKALTNWIENVDLSEVMGNEHPLQLNNSRGNSYFDWSQLELNGLEEV